MIYLFRKTVFNCKQATLLSIKREEGRITGVERMKLWYHLLYCDPCRRFIDQWDLLNKEIKKSKKNALFTMSEQSKEDIQRRINEMNS